MSEPQGTTVLQTAEAVAEAIYGKLPHYLTVMNKLLANIEAHTQ